MGETAWLIALTVVALGLIVLAGELRMRATSRRLDEVQARLDRRDDHLEERDERLTRREATLESKAATLELREANLLERERGLAAGQAELDDARIVQRKRLEEVADYSADEARQALLDEVEAEARQEAFVLVRDIENRAREEGERRAREILVTAIQRVAVDTATATAVSVVELPDDEMKGRIIGRDGRNIRAFEQVTGVNLVVDETPKSVTLSCFDPLRRESARLALERLVADGRIHPTSIETAHEAAQRDLEQSVERAGHAAVEEADVAGVAPELVRILGQLQLRTSYGQNVLRHVIETAHLAGMMASEFGFDPKLARRCGLLHDVGKALTHQVKGTHAAIGAELAQQCGESPAVCHAIAAHHGEVTPSTVEAVLTQAADAVSASRPGARRDAHEHYVVRLRGIEELCASFPGVERVFAMQAGRDVRVMVSPEAVDDEGARALVRDISARIEQELAYPGQIAITVVRELRVSGIAD